MGIKMDYDREDFKSKTAVVTGAAAGIGFALVEELLESNTAKVVMANINEANLTASHILKGVVDNDRIIFDDDYDLNGARHCFTYESHKGNDEYFLRVTRERREGKVSF